jgi:hypothetical protein
LSEASKLIKEYLKTSSYSFNLLWGIKSQIYYNIFNKLFQHKNNTAEKSAVPFYTHLVTTAAAVVVAKSSAEKKYDDKDNDPRSTVAATTIVTTHNQTSFHFSKSYYERKEDLLQIGCGQSPPSIRNS